MYPKTMLKAIRDISQCEAGLVHQRMGLHRQVTNDFAKHGWSDVRTNALVSWGIADCINFHRLNLFQMKEDVSGIVRYRNEDQDAFFEDCTACFLRACIDLWQQEKETKQQVNVEVQRSFEGPKVNKRSRQGIRPDIFVSSREHVRPVIIIECKSGQGYSRKNWEDGTWEKLISIEREKAKRHVRYYEKRKGLEFKTPKYSNVPCDIRYYKLILYMPDVLQPKNSKGQFDERQEEDSLKKELRLMKQENTYILLAEGPAYENEADYLNARKEMTEGEMFVHKAEDLFSKIKNDLKL